MWLTPRHPTCRAEEKSRNEGKEDGGGRIVVNIVDSELIVFWQRQSYW